jgi:hypothetical protein
MFFVDKNVEKVAFSTKFLGLEIYESPNWLIIGALCTLKQTTPM